ncbi:MAG: hypothetical protein AAFO95_03430 [Cyanobacteria bacterium J06600_6]
MNVNSSCPCCSRSMLLHLSSRRSFWFCSHCRLEVPNSYSLSGVNNTTTIKFNSSGLKKVIAPLQSSPQVAAI